MKTLIASHRFADLLKLFNTLVTLHDELLVLIRAKIDAMKKSDVNRIQTLTEQERQVARRIHEREGLRRQLMDGLGGQIGLPPRAARALSASQLAGRLREPQKTDLLEAAGRLRDGVTRMAATNRMAGAIAGQIINHLHWVFASVRPPGDRPMGYSDEGALVASSQTKILDAVG
jgi:hypothetical protein